MASSNATSTRTDIIDQRDTSTRSTSACTNQERGQMSVSNIAFNAKNQSSKQKRWNIKSPQSLVGKMWEIFWDPKDDINPTTNNKDSSTEGTRTGGADKRIIMPNNQGSRSSRDQSSPTSVQDQDRSSYRTSMTGRTSNKSTTGTGIGTRTDTDEMAPCVSSTDDDESGSASGSASTSSTAPSTASSSSSSSDYEADWYDAHIKSYSEEKGVCVFEVVFVGDKKIYRMPLSEDIVRPSDSNSSTSTSNSTSSCEDHDTSTDIGGDDSTFVQWKNSIVGKDWEVFWSELYSTKASDNNDGNDNNANDEGFDADWYDAHIQNFSQETNTFQVKFVGEEGIYNMSLEPHMVRPLSQAHDTCMNDDDDDDAFVKWKNSIVGKDWEVFWAELYSTKASETHGGNDNNANDEGFDADWYDAHIQNFSQETNTFQVKFVGEEGIYNMSLEPHMVRPMSKAHLNTGDNAFVKWKNSIVGKDWEVFWSEQHSSKASGTTSNSSNDNGDDDEGFDADWYDARILSYSPNISMFQVNFVGEEEIYNMPLQPHIVRPSSRIWVRRTKHLINLSSKEILDTNGSAQKVGTVCDRLPQSTELLSDDDENDNDYSDLSHTRSDQTFDMRCYRLLLEKQIHLRSRLIFAQDNENHSKTVDENSEGHVNYLVHCLERIIYACNWYEHCSHSHGQWNALSSWVMSISPTSAAADTLSEVIPSSVQIPVQNVYVRILDGVISFLRALLLDTNRLTVPKKEKNTTSVAGKGGNKIRNHNSPSMISSSRKRRRTGVNKKVDVYTEYSRSSYARSEPCGSYSTLLNLVNMEYSLDPDSILATWKAIVQCSGVQSNNCKSNDGGLSMEVIGILIQKCLRKENCSRYIIEKLSSSLLDTTGHIWEHLVFWIDEARNILRSNDLEDVQKIEDLLVWYDDSDSYERDSVSFQLRSIDDITDCLKRATSNRLLSQFDLSGYQNALRRKAGELVSFQKTAKDVIDRSFTTRVVLPKGSVSYDQSDLEECDTIVSRLRELMQDPSCIEGNISGHEILHDTILFGDRELTRQDINYFLDIRIWMIHCEWVCSRRERDSEIEAVFKAKPDENDSLLKGCEQISSYVDQLRTNITVSWMKLQELRNSKIRPTTKSIEDDNCEIKHRDLLSRWSQHHILTCEEEQLALLTDIFAWIKKARSCILSSGKKRLSFDAIESLFEKLQGFRKGKSSTRHELTLGLLTNQDRDQTVIDFSKKQILKNCNDIALSVTMLYNKACEWGRKARFVEKALKYYGNDCVESSGIVQKVNNMIDLKVIDDLCEEHDANIYDFPFLHATLCRVKNTAHVWTQQLLSAVPNSHLSADEKIMAPLDIAKTLQQFCERRPNGILMFPSRQLCGEWLDLLSWYNQCTDSFHLLQQYHEKESSNEDLPDSNAFNVMRMNNQIETLIAKGHALIHQISEPVYDSCKDPDRQNISFTIQEQEMFARTFESPSLISLDKLRSCDKSIQLLNAIMTYDLNLKERGVIFLIRLYLWHHLAADTLNKIKGGSKSKPGVESTKSLLCRVEKIPISLESIAESNPLVNFIFRTKYLTIQQLIEDAERVESEVVIELNKIELHEGDFSTQFISLSLSHIKDARRKLKSLNDSGLSINPSLSTKVDKRIRDLNWLDSVTSFSIFQDIDQDAECKSIAKDDRIPFDSLIHLYEKAPSHLRSNNDTSPFTIEMANLYSRLKDIKEQCVEWQVEVYLYFPRTVRVSRRRDNISRHSNESEDLMVITNTELKELHNVSTSGYVCMPEEEILEAAMVHAINLQEGILDLFNEDHNGLDRMKLPTLESLIGEAGEFYLYRVVKSHEYELMKEKLASMQEHITKLPANTPEKLLYIWLSGVIHWVEKIEESLIEPNGDDGSLEKIHISIKDAESLIEEGQQVFSDLSENCRKFLLHLRLSVFVRSGTLRLSVKSCKGGSNHSIGGTVLRWVAFCLNSLRNDLASTMYWSKRATTAIGKDASISNLLILSDLVQEANDFLMVSPDHEILRKIAAMLNNNSMPVKGGDKSTSSVQNGENPVFVHNLLMECMNLHS